MNTPNLPEEQEKLLRDLNELDTLERLGILPERSNINIFLLTFTWVLGILVAIASIVNNEAFYLNRIILFCVSISIGLAASYYNKNWGYYIASFGVIAVNAYLLTIVENHMSPFVALIDALTIFMLSNQFGRKGFIASGITIFIKNIVIFLIFGDRSELVNLFSNIITALSVGLIPVLIRSISQFSRSAKRQEIRAAILALQNQDLLKSWQAEVYGDTAKPEENNSEPKSEAVNNQEPLEVSADSGESIYTSPYS